jgi:hypothetical protein
MNVMTLIQEQTPVKVLVRLLDGNLRVRLGLITSFDGKVIRVFDIMRNEWGSFKGFRSTPTSHVLQIEVIPATHPVYATVRQAIPVAYGMGY